MEEEGLASSATAATALDDLSASLDGALGSSAKLVPRVATLAQALDSARRRTPIYIAWSSEARLHFVSLMPTLPTEGCGRETFVDEAALPTTSHDNKTVIFGYNEAGEQVSRHPSYSRNRHGVNCNFAHRTLRNVYYAVRAAFRPRF